MVITDDGRGGERGTEQLPPHFDASVGFLLNKAAQILLEDFERELRPFEITAREFGVLRYIDLQGGESQQRIGASLRIDRSTMVSIVDELERRELVARVRDPQDRRRYAITLTDHGRDQVRRKLARIEAQVSDRFLAGLDSYDRQRLVEILVELVARAEARGHG